MATSFFRHLTAIVYPKPLAKLVAGPALTQSQNFGESPPPINCPTCNNLVVRSPSLANRRQRNRRPHGGPVQEHARMALLFARSGDWVRKQVNCPRDCRHGGRTSWSDGPTRSAESVFASCCPKRSYSAPTTFACIAARATRAIAGPATCSSRCRARSVTGTSSPPMPSPTVPRPYWPAAHCQALVCLRALFLTRPRRMGWFVRPWSTTPADACASWELPARTARRPPPI